MSKSAKTPPKNGDIFQDWGIGCAIQIVLIVIFCAIVSSNRSTDFAAYWLLLGFPALLVRYLLFNAGKVRGINGRLLGPLFMVLAILLAYIAPTEDDSSQNPEKSAANEERTESAEKPEAAEKSAASSTNEKSAAEEQRSRGEVPPGVRVTEPDPEKIATVEEAIAQLDELIGLEPVKAEVRKFVSFVQVSQKRREQGLKVASITYHMVFSGNPGTGKTTVARIMADIYRTLGIVKSGHLVECDRGGLIAEYVGQTAVKTGKVIDFAMDGVLFIDEAYAITDDGSKGYGGECIATLLKRMEDDRDRLVVIIAGYTNEMKSFIDSNPGLQSRFNRYIDFPDYSAEELAAIFRMNAKKNQYILSAELEKALDPFIAEKTRRRDRKFGNARWVRNLLDEAIVRQAMRLASAADLTKEELMTLTPEDVGIENFAAEK